ncbi:MAG: DEAD/DEAH box helicase, partial [Ideonella sp.]
LAMLGEMGALDSKRRAFTGVAVQSLIRELAQDGWLVDVPQRMGYWQVAPPIRSAVFLEAIDLKGLAPLRAGLAGVTRFDDSMAGSWTHFSDVDAAAAIVRLEVFGGVPFEQVSRLRQFCRFGLSWADVMQAAIGTDLDDRLIARLEPALQINISERYLVRLISNWIAPPIDAIALAWQQIERHPDPEDTGNLRLTLAESVLWSGQPQQLPDLLKPLLEGGSSTASPTRVDDPARAFASVAQAALAGWLALQGRWSEAEQAFDHAFAQLKDVTGRRKNLLPELMVLPYVLALLAQGSPAHLERALKFCLAESGKRQASADSGWGLIALAIQVRRGDNRLDLGSFRPLSDNHHVYRIDLWRWLMRAWLKTGSEAVDLHSREQDAAQRLRARLNELGFDGLADQLDAALARLRGEAASPAFFVSSSREGWQLALAELATLAAGGTSISDADQSSRLLWVLDIDHEGRVRDLLPFEQKRGARGWGKPREVALSKLVKTEGLAQRDAAVAVALRPLPNRERGHRFDLAAAVSALVGHPAIELADARGAAVELIESQAELDVSEVDDSVRLKLVPPLRAEPPISTGGPWSPSVTELKEMEALRLITVLRDGPQRARLIRLSPEQKRAAQLIGEQLVVPKSALSQVQAVLQSLGTHFQVHADVAQDDTRVREVVADSRLRAELSPRGGALHVRLVVAPLGVDGPRLAPGHGRSRLLAAVDGETLGAPRDLALERSHLEAILDACPMLDPADDGGAQWLIEAPDDALALLEQLPSLAAISGIDWPQGKPVRVESVGVSQLRVQLRSGREWLALQGGIAVDEAQVMSLEQLLEWTRSERSRFVPLGEGRYLALTQELRNRLDELGSVAHSAGGKGKRGNDGELHVSPLAAAWLDATLADTGFAADAAFEARVLKLQQIQSTQPILPGTLQAELRPYQEEGFAWAMRLAEAGFGAILADDMGLGKTLQALAILLARSAGGPALVVAPTSLGGNWLAEARRFAPSLNISLFGEGERATLIGAASAGDVIVVSYQLLLIHADDFGRRQWHTMVLDEAQAIKNATAKRSQAAFELQADFRIALSGTPIENRLSELWSIMRVCNPGLLGTSRQFNERFAGPIERDRNRNAQRTLRRLIAPFVLRRTKAQVLDDLPPRTETTLVIEADSTERAHYETLRRQALAAAEAAVASDKPGQAQLNILAQLTRLRRAACDPRLVSPQLGLIGAKVKAFAELATELRANGHKTLVFSQFVDFLTLLREPLDAAGIPYQYLDGSTPPAERTRRVAAFQAGEGDLFLISLKAGGFGLNLTVADYVVIADPWWNPAAEDQASGRAHRIGQLRPVTVYRLVNQGTLEEKIVALHQQKRELADSVLDGGEASTALRADELIELMRGKSSIDPDATTDAA